MMKQTLCLLILLLGQCILPACQSNESTYQTIKEKEFTELSRKKNVVVLDVRTPEEYQEEHLENAVLLNYNGKNFQTELTKLDNTKTYLVYCKAGGRSAKTSEALSAKGHKVYNLDGGISHWTGKIVH